MDYFETIICQEKAIKTKSCPVRAAFVVLIERVT